MRNKHKKFIRTELDYLFEKAKETITKASPTDASRISGVFQNLAARAKSPISKKKISYTSHPKISNSFKRNSR